MPPRRASAALRTVGLLMLLQRGRVRKVSCAGRKRIAHSPFQTAQTLSAVLLQVKRRENSLAAITRSPADLWLISDVAMISAAMSASVSGSMTKLLPVTSDTVELSTAKIGQ